MEKIYGMHKLVGLQLFWSGTPTFSSGTPTFCQMGVLNSRLGGRNHPRFKPPWSICQKVVNTGQYESEWSIENFKGRFCGGLRYLYRFYVLSIEKRKKNYFVPAKGTLHGEIFISRP